MQMREGEGKTPYNDHSVTDANQVHACVSKPEANKFKST